MDKEVEQPKRNRIRKLPFLFLCVSFAFWLVIGGAVFQAIESPVADDERMTLLDLRNSFLHNVSSCITGWF